MKNVFHTILICVFIALIIFVPLAIAFQDVYGVILKIGGGSIIGGIVITPFAAIGAFNVFRGFGAVFEKDEEKFGNKLTKNWKFSIYLLFHIVGYLAFYYAITQCL